MTGETSMGVDSRNVCPKSGQECDFFIKLNEELTAVSDVAPEVIAGMSQDDSELVMYNPQRHAAAISGARKIAVQHCVSIDANCGLPSQQKSTAHHGRS